jgi:hypothetical protein
MTGTQATKGKLGRTRRAGLSVGIGCACVAASAFAQPAQGLMSGEAVRVEFADRTFEGYYFDGERWVSHYTRAGRYSVVRRRSEQGVWYIHNDMLCVRYDRLFVPSLLPVEHCLLTTKIGSNCYEFVWMWPDGSPRGPPAAWHARGWRQGEVNTCEASPPTS